MAHHLQPGHAALRDNQRRHQSPYQLQHHSFDLRRRCMGHTIPADAVAQRRGRRQRQHHHLAARLLVHRIRKQLPECRGQWRSLVGHIQHPRQCQAAALAHPHRTAGCRDGRQRPHHRAQCLQEPFGRHQGTGRCASRRGDGRCRCHLCSSVGQPDGAVRCRIDRGRSPECHRCAPHGGQDLPHRRACGIGRQPFRPHLHAHQHRLHQRQDRLAGSDYEQRHGQLQRGRVLPEVGHGAAVIGQHAGRHLPRHLAGLPASGQQR